MTDRDTTRRRFIALTASTGVAGLAGCMGGDGGGGDDTTTAMSEMTSTGMEGNMTEGTMTEGGMNETTEEGMGSGMNSPTDPDEAPQAAIDRFSEDAGTLFVRSEMNGLPGPDEAVDFDSKPFLTKGLGPDGGDVSYYNFDVQSTQPAPIYAFFREDGTPVEDQLNVVGVVPGDEGYNDFWRVNKVTVPDDYHANTVTSASELMDAGYPVETTNVIKNCPIVPAGSTASMRAGDAPTDLVRGWYGGEVVHYFLFEEASLSTTGSGAVPLSPIYVSFNTNPGESGGGPASGFMTEMESDRTHNVLATLPGDDGYSPLWLVNVYDNADFRSVSDLETARMANVLASGAAMVNCPVVSTP